jgi:alpha,alpha-trehalose phosphorylase
VEIRAAEASYELLHGDPLELDHHGEQFSVAADSPVTLPIEPLEPRPTPAQPPGREPPEWSLEADVA